MTCRHHFYIEHFVRYISLASANGFVGKRSADEVLPPPKTEEILPGVISLPSASTNISLTIDKFQFLDNTCAFSRKSACPLSSTLSVNSCHLTSFPTNVE